MSGFCDIHTHVLPGIDDGAKDWDMSLEMIDKSWKGGVRRIIATPHYVPWQKRENDPGKIIRLCRDAELRAKAELGHDIKIYPGQEIYYHIEMLEKIEQGKVLTLAGSHYILVEFPIDISWHQLKQAISHIIYSSQYRPILAHIERYECLRTKENLEEAKELGALFQMNIKSLQGGILDHNTRWCKKQLLDAKIDFLSSDMHNLTSRPPTSYDMLEWIGKKIDREYQKDIFMRNALKIGI